MQGKEWKTLGAIVRVNESDDDLVMYPYLIESQPGQFDVVYSRVDENDQPHSRFERLGAKPPSNSLGREMMANIGFLLDRASATLLIFAAFAALAGIATMKPAMRIGAGLIGLILAACLTISGRSLFDWLVSAIERPSAPGLLLMIMFAISAATGRSYQSVPEFRFGTAILALGGLVLYPGAIGFLNYDTYILGYSGYLLPLLLAAILGYAIYRRYVLVALALNIGILGFLLSAGRSLNLWDYVIDPVAWFLAIGSWVAIAVNLLRRKPVATPALVS